jgi:UDP-N-acetylmuramoyl-L-alanyl-D-glutamate--2,6-diaminopimelate ligase
MLLSQLVSALPKILARSEGDPDITSIEENSRNVKPGSLFVARRGTIFDGHKFVEDALRRGARAIVVEKDLKEIMGNKGKDFPLFPSFPLVPFIQVPDSSEALAWLCATFHNFPARKMIMIGVTGTDGKTTTSTLIHSILVAAGFKVGLISTVNAIIGEQVLDTGLHTTTPDAPDVQRYLKQMVDAGMTHCVLETTSHGIAQHRVTACEFDIAVVTNITHEHLDFHKTIDEYRAAKAKLFEGLSTSAKKNIAKLAVLNRDDWSFDYLRERITVDSISYGLNDNADVKAKNIVYAPDSTRFAVEISNSQFPITNYQTHLVGDFNISNCLAALTATVKGLGVDVEAAARGIESVKGVAGRLERIDLGQDFISIVDFAHTPNALQRILQVARTLTRGRVLVVFGSAGLRDVAKRKWMGEIAAEFADLTIITAEDPRTESLEAILAESAEGATSKGGIEGKTFWRIADRGEAIQFAIDRATAGDVVLVCGKAHEQSMCFGTIEYPWDDRVAVRAALAKRLGLSGYAMPKLPTSRG